MIFNKRKTFFERCPGIFGACGKHLLSASCRFFGSWLPAFSLALGAPARLIMVLPRPGVCPFAERAGSRICGADVPLSALGLAAVNRPSKWLGCPAKFFTLCPGQRFLTHVAPYSSALEAGTGYMRQTGRRSRRAFFCSLFQKRMQRGAFAWNC